MVVAGLARKDGSWDPVYNVPLMPLTGGSYEAVLPAGVDRFTFYGEATGLIAFGISWLTASRVLPGLTRPVERFSPLRQVNPP